MNGQLHCDTERGGYILEPWICTVNKSALLHLSSLRQKLYIFPSFHQHAPKFFFTSFLQYLSS